MQWVTQKKFLSVELTMNISKTLFFFCRGYKRTEYAWFRYSKLLKLNVFKIKILKFIRPKVNSFFNYLNPKGVKLIPRLRVALCNLRDHKFKHSFQDCLKPICSCGIEIETTAHFLLHCLNYFHEGKTLLDNITSVLRNILEQITLLLIIFFSLVLPSSLCWWLFKYNYLKCNNQLYNIYKKIWWFYIYDLRVTIKPF